MKEFLKLVYYNLPRSLRLGYKTYKSTLKEISQVEKFDQSKIEDWQFNKLKALIDFCWKNNEGYYEFWKENGFSPDQFQCLNDLNKIPIITKERIRTDVLKFTSNNLTGIKKVTTGGSSGVPMEFYYDSKKLFVEEAFITDYIRRFIPNYHFSQPSVVLKGKKQKKAISITRQFGLYLSSYDLNENNLKKYVEAIENCGYDLLQAYPSSLYLFAGLLKNKEIRLKHRFKCILLASEPLYEFQKELINDVFKTKIAHFYGHTEHAVSAGNCEYSDKFHIYPQYGIAEIHDERGIPVKEGEVGEIVGTGLWNYATPFIRYKTADFAEKGSSFCEKCRRPYSLINRIEGREQDLIVDKKLTKITLTAVIFAQHFDAFSRIKKMQVVQNEVGIIKLHILVNDEFNQQDIYELKNGIESKAEHNLTVEVIANGEIKQTARGKIPFLIQYLDLSKLK